MNEEQPEHSIFEMLMRLPLFQGVTRREMTHILAVIPFDFRTFSFYDVICQSGDYCQGVTFLLSGKVRLETPVFNGRIRITQIFEAPYTFSLHHLFGAETAARSTMKAESPRTGLMLLVKRDFLRLLHETDISLINTLNILCTRAQKQHKAIDFSGEYNPLLRLASWMLAFSENAAAQVYFEAGKSDWCDLLQVDEAGFWRCVATLEGEKIVEVQQNRLRLLDRYSLKTFLRRHVAAPTSLLS